VTPGKTVGKSVKAVKEIDEKELEELLEIRRKWLEQKREQAISQFERWVFGVGTGLKPVPGTYYTSKALFLWDYLKRLATSWLGWKNPYGLEIPVSSNNMVQIAFDTGVILGIARKLLLEDEVRFRIIKAVTQALLLAIQNVGDDEAELATRIALAIDPRATFSFTLKENEELEIFGERKIEVSIADGVNVYKKRDPFPVYEAPIDHIIVKVEKGKTYVYSVKKK